MRAEYDALGELNVPKIAYYGIHSVRARENFPITGLPRFARFYHSLVQVKLAAAQTNAELGYLEPAIAVALIEALTEMADGALMDQFIIDPMQGGAGTSTNMAINEIAANRASEILGQPRGSYKVDPIEHVNLHQSTNDVYPTAVRVTVYRYLTELETILNDLLLALQDKEKAFSGIIKPSRTELMTAIPTTLGKSFSAFSEAIGRDRWRIFKCQERVRQVNLGGTAIGLGTAAPRDYIFKVTDQLRKLTGYPLARAENMVDAGQNLDTLAEVFGMIKVVAVNLEKITHDIRLMLMLRELNAEPLQVGSSIMPGKSNPVIFEMMAMAAKKVMGNEHTGALAMSQGELELNTFLPLIAYAMFESCELLVNGIPKFTEKGIIPLTANAEICRQALLNTPSSTTLLLPVIGYIRAGQVAAYMIDHHLDMVSAVKALNILDHDTLEQLISPQSILQLGTTLQPREEPLS